MPGLQSEETFDQELISDKIIPSNEQVEDSGGQRTIERR